MSTISSPKPSNKGYGIIIDQDNDELSESSQFNYPQKYTKIRSSDSEI